MTLMSSIADSSVDNSYQVLTPLYVRYASEKAGGVRGGAAEEAAAGGRSKGQGHSSALY